MRSMNIDSKKLSEVYGKDYFFGKGSGYPTIGYHQAHPTWGDYLDFIQSVKGPAWGNLGPGNAHE